MDYKKILKITSLIIVISSLFISCITLSTADIDERAAARENMIKTEYPTYIVPEGTDLHEYIVSYNIQDVKDYNYDKTIEYKSYAEIAGTWGRSNPDKAYREAEKNLQRKLYLEGYSAALIKYKEYTFEHGMYDYDNRVEYVEHFMKMDVELFKK